MQLGVSNIDGVGAIENLAETLTILRLGDGFQFISGESSQSNSRGAVALPPLRISELGDASFRKSHNVSFAYMTGAMANGIASVELVEAIAGADMLGIFGAAGLSLERIEQAILTLRRNLGGKTFGVNLIHSPNEQAHEMATAELLLRHRVSLVEASAYLDLTPAIVRFRLSGIRQTPSGQIETPNRVIGKVSRAEVAARFLSPAPERIVKECVEKGWLTAAEAELGRRVPMADDLTVEADSGGHTDNRPLISLLPATIALRDRLQAQYRYPMPVRVGAAGGISTPASIAAAFAMGAAYVVTGSINQACVESGSCDAVRQMLAEADQADIAMAPAADMFEMGVKVQVLKRGTMFAMRAAKLYELYRSYSSIEAIPTAERVPLEKNLFREPLENIWRQTEDYFQKRDPAQVTRAAAEPKHKMALVFRWYLGQSSRWANGGEASRRLDYQVWCGPAMGAFNEWTKGSYLESARNRRAAYVAKNLMLRAGVVLRRLQIRLQGIELPEHCFPTAPLEPSELDAQWKEATAGTR